MNTFAIQYLEPNPEVANISPSAAQDRLQAAFNTLPIDHVLIGWDVPDSLLDACAKVCTKQGAALYRWHPLLTGDGTLMPKPTWQTIGLDGNPIPGFKGMPEFTFICPNRPAVQDAVFNHLQDLLQDSPYQGVFLDRMRLPSPAPDPGRLLGCFCEDCHHTAQKEGLDLTAVQASIQRLISTPETAKQYITALLNPAKTTDASSDMGLLHDFLAFRTRSVTRFIQQSSAIIKSAGLPVGLDCFSTSLTPMVGQDLHRLKTMGTWTKIMSYGHTLGPAGMPFELLHLAEWLLDTHGITESDALACLADATGLPLPNNRATLRNPGLSSAALAMEAQKAQANGPGTILAGIELVEMAGVTHLNVSQIAADVRAFLAAGVDGLALSWDLWRMPHQSIKTVATAWGL